MLSDGSSESGGGGGRATPHQQQSRAASTVPLSPKRIKLSSASPVGSVAHSHGSSTPHSIPSLSPPYSSSGKPLPLPHMPHSAASLMSSSSSGGNNNNCGSSGRLGELAMPFSRSFMMDYMWQQHHNHHHQSTSNNNNNNSVHQGLIKSTGERGGLTTGSVVVATPPFPIPPYALPWLKRPSALFFPPTGNGGGIPGDLPPSSSGTASFIDSKAFSFYNNSAFKPVNGAGGRHQEQQQTTAAMTVPVVMRQNGSIVKDPVSSGDEQEDVDEEVFNNNNSPVFEREGARRRRRQRMPMTTVVPEEENEEEDDEILVDIETTEDDEVMVMQLKAAAATVVDGDEDVKDDPRMSPAKLYVAASLSPASQQLDSNNNQREVGFG